MYNTPKKEVEIEDKISVTIGETHIFFKSLEFFNLGGGTTTGALGVTGWAELAYGTYGLWKGSYYEPLMRVANSRPTTGNFQTDFLLQSYSDQGIGSFPDGSSIW